MIPDTISPEATDEQLCQLAEKWKIEGELLERIFCMAGRLPFGLQIISGYRSPEHQLELKRSGRPAAHPDISTHCACPATGADLWPTIAVSRVVKATFGEAARVCGLRWGGGSPVDPDNGIPSDWNHVDLGPRRAS